MSMLDVVRSDVALLRLVLPLPLEVGLVPHLVGGQDHEPYAIESVLRFYNPESSQDKLALFNKSFYDLLTMRGLDSLGPASQLRELLDERGVAAPDGTVARSEDWGMDLHVAKLYGVEVALPAGAIGRLVVRKVDQLLDGYATNLPEGGSAVKAFNESRMSGVLAEAQVRSVSSNHLFVARKAILQMQNSSSTSQMTMSTSRKFALGRPVDTEGLLEFDASHLAVVRSLDPSEMDYSEPGMVAMIFAALKRR